ncbi:Tetratricopeptide repeat superfamily protein [Perilla frutescens var. frutescens]|nr:Tetratricopeptide repeat superfamily protein [Perilla frutescens var. frutescens]
MALRFAARKTVSSSAPLLQRSAAGRCASSSSPKANKKVANDRLASVIDAVNDRKLPPELRGQRNNVRSETDILNVVEQRVWHAMEEGQFENLSGKGKPLNLDTNPHADPAEDTLYRILNKNGCAPEWVERNKEIRNSIAGWRLALRRAWMSKDGCDDSKWLETSEALKLQLRDLNNKVTHYNLIVPFGRQMFGCKWEREIDRVKEEVQLGN